MSKPIYPRPMAWPALRTSSAATFAVDVDLDSVTAAIERGEVGKLVEVEDEANRQTVEI